MVLEIASFTFLLTLEQLQAVIPSPAFAFFTFFDVNKAKIPRPRSGSFLWLLQSTADVLNNHVRKEIFTMSTLKSIYEERLHYKSPRRLLLKKQ